MAPTRGLTLLRARFANFMQAKLPGLIDVSRTAWGLADWQLPHPADYDAYDPFKANKFPSVSLTAAADTNHVRSDVTDLMELEYYVQYACVISVVVRTPRNPADNKWAVPHYDETLRLRDDLTKLVQALIKQDPDFGVQGVRLDEDTINTSYQPAVHPNSQAPEYVAAGVISLNINQRELTYNVPIGTADTINLITDVVQIKEEMP